MENPYKEYKYLVEELEHRGYKKEFVILTSSCTNNIIKANINSLSGNCSEEIFDIEPTPGTRLILPPSFGDYNIMMNYGLALSLFDKQGKELKGDTLIQIDKIESSTAMLPICSIFYSNIRYGGCTLFNIFGGIELNHKQRLSFRILNYDISNLDIKRCEMIAKLDLFTMNYSEEKESSNIRIPFEYTDNEVKNHYLSQFVEWLKRCK